MLQATLHRIRRSIQRTRICARSPHPATGRTSGERPAARSARSATARSCGRSSPRRSLSPRRAAPSTGRARQPRLPSRSQPSDGSGGRPARRESCCARGCGGCDSSDDVHAGHGARPGVVERPACRTQPIAIRGRGGRMRDERAGAGDLRSMRREGPADAPPPAVPHPRPDEIRSRIPTLLANFEMTSVQSGADA